MRLFSQASLFCSPPSYSFSRYQHSRRDWSSCVQKGDDTAEKDVNCPDSRPLICGQLGIIPAEHLLQRLYCSCPQLSIVYKAVHGCLVELISFPVIRLRVRRVCHSVGKRDDTHVWLSWYPFLLSNLVRRVCHSVGKRDVWLCRPQS